ncbi:MAG TPA: chemotaxis protein CheW, partial [bacterium]|nr:chemotaxis protein CheW [bacterium]
TSIEISTYKQLAYTGIETRFSSLNSGEKSEESSGTEAPSAWNRAEEWFSRIGVLEEKMEGLLRDMEVHLSSFKGQRAEAKGRPVNVTVFKVDQKLLGVESGKVLKLFKLPNRLDERYFNQGKVRLKEFETRIIDLRKILSLERRRETQDVKILMVRENGEYKGLMVDQVIKNLSARAETDQEQGEYFSGAIHWTYQEHPVIIPILDLKNC